MKFGTPLHLWALLLVPALVALFWWAHGVRRRKLHEFLAPLLAARLTPSVSTQRRIVKEGMITAALAIVLLAAARPQWGYTWEKLERRGIELVIVLDTSLSMLAQDAAPDRLERAKLELKELVTLLQGDQVALVPFAGQPIVLCPMTLGLPHPRALPRPDVDRQRAAAGHLRGHRGAPGARALPGHQPGLEGDPAHHRRRGPRLRTRWRRPTRRRRAAYASSRSASAAAIRCRSPSIRPAST
ncbi:MAG: VWA domain-containing protein [Deltaproteobacteria bacterium]|nr:VWA domain-containing protein [Deltaproteobacteria bacterium]